MPKLILGTSVHENFDSFLDLSKGVKKFYNDPVYIYASNEDLGKPKGSLVKIEARRNYKWRRSHHFIFDACEYLKDRDYDYFVGLDSDCLVNGDGLNAFIGGGGFDFMIYPNLNGLGGWYHGNVFLKNIGLYLGILKELGLKRADETVVGNFNPLIILSKKAVDFLSGRVPRIEASDSYRELMKLDFSVGETLLFNILKDAGFKHKYIDAQLKRGLRYRPHWEVDEFQEAISVYHPVRRKKNDLFRRLVGIGAGYDKNYLFLPLIYARRLYLAARDKFFKDRTRQDPRVSEEGWFNP